MASHVSIWSRYLTLIRAYVLVWRIQYIVLVQLIDFCRSESCKSEQYFSKSDKKQEGVLKLVSQIAVLFFLVSGAFFAGYSIAGFPLDAKSARSNQDTEHWGKVARQLSHQEAKTGSVVIAGIASPQDPQFIRLLNSRKKHD